MSGRLALLIVSILLAGCVVAIVSKGPKKDEQGVPLTAVAIVSKKHQVSRSDFSHWLKIAERGSSGSATIDPPKYEQCIKSLRKQADAAKPTEASLLKQCRDQDRQARQQVMNFLLTSLWVKLEADKLGIKVNDAEVRRTFAKEKKKSFKTEEQYQRFLKSSGMSHQDILLQVSNSIRHKKIRALLSKNISKPTDKEIGAYYRQNKRQFAQPYRRDIEMVVVKNKATASKTLAALQAGQSWASVARRYSEDEFSKGQGGKVAGIARNQSPPEMEKALFAAKVGVITGPVKSRGGYTIFRVSKIHQASQQSLAQVRDIVAEQLDNTAKQKVINAWLRKFDQRWRARTICAQGFQMDGCHNYKSKPVGF